MTGAASCPFRKCRCLLKRHHDRFDDRFKVARAAQADSINLEVDVTIKGNSVRAVLDREPPDADGAIVRKRVKRAAHDANSGCEDLDRTFGNHRRLARSAFDNAGKAFTPVRSCRSAIDMKRRRGVASLSAR